MGYGGKAKAIRELTKNEERGLARDISALIPAIPLQKGGWWSIAINCDFRGNYEKYVGGIFLSSMVMNKSENIYCATRREVQKPEIIWSRKKVGFSMELCT